MPTFADLEKGAEIGSRQIPVTRADLVAYAGASGDFNPIHWNERFATEVGLPGVIAHGMFTMGAAVQLVTDWVGDAGAIVDYQTRFSKPVPVPDAQDAASPATGGNVITVAGKVGALHEESQTARIDLTVTAPDTDGKDQKVLMKAQALVKL
ncbi:MULTISPECIES: MaoC family dehydratase [Rothia]|uniref:MaoC family dehydratase n=1 Tax=Rothia endophytica TaxID=1324766 RepID=A0ABP9B3G9_9MICC|nr:MaoC family dehydratase [Rothia sp. P100]MCM3509723.1 MaoC family dehydratase [Rothia sp. P100]SLE59987.1 (3R)-hydroxyacyl-ACP dehydratase subunit HadB [Mycobacteroides abscessus subsp. bolletii]